MTEVYSNPTIGATDFFARASRRFSGERLRDLQRHILAWWRDEETPRKPAAQELAAKEAQALAVYAQTVNISIDPFPDDLRKAYADHLRQLADCYEQDGTRHVEASRIVAMLRHAHSNYEALVGPLKYRTGSQQAYKIIKNRVNEAIRARLAGIIAERPVEGGAA